MFHLIRIFINVFNASALRGFGGNGGSSFWKIYNDPRVIHWYAENNDLALERFSTLPTGLTWVQNPDDFSDHPPRESILPIKERPLKVLVADRVRGGSPQWNLRFELITMCEWASTASWCMRPEQGGFKMDEGLSHKNFLEIVTSVPFIACPHGGGIDPSPKAWEALLVGSIPIIEHSTLDNAYSKFPVMLIDSFKKDLFERPNMTEVTLLLEEWREKLAPYYEEGSELRKQTLERLRTDYWIGIFREEIQEYERKKGAVEDGWDSLLNETTRESRGRSRKLRNNHPN